MNERRATPVRMVAIGVMTLAAIWFVATTTIGSVFSRSRPAIALSASPGNAEANANRAMQLFREEPLRPDWTSITPLARVALARSPGNVTALAMLGGEADATRRPVLANRLFEHSDRLSRHDQITQIYLIEAAVSRGDIAAALTHYNAALSTSRASADLLMPTLVSASADPAVARPVAALLATRPVWRTEFARRLVNTRAEWGVGFSILVAALRLDARDPDERAILSIALDRLIDARRGSYAYDLYRRATSAPPSPATIRNGGFEEDDRLPPFDWSIRDGNGATGYVQPLAGSNVLFVAVDGADAEVASQRLLLAPGRYAVGARMGSEEQAGGEIALSIRCGTAGTNAIPLVVVRAPAGAVARSYRTSFVVPEAGCAEQKLSVRAGAAEQAGRPSWIDAVTIDRTP